MFFDDVREIQKIAERVGTAVFVVPNEVKADLPRAITLKPEEKTTITIEQVRELMRILNVKQQTEQFVVVRPADKMQPEAANAFLKTLEEPRDKIHFVLITDAPSKLLATILSRSAIYFLKIADFNTIHADEKDKELAKRLMVARPNDLPKLAEEITKKKEGARERSLTIVGVAIEMLYKTYLINGKEAFLLKLPKFLQLYENLSRNGHIKLHLVADLI